MRTWYGLTLERTELAIGLNSGLSPHLKGADSVIAALAEELQIPVKTFDAESLQRYPNATS